MRSYHKCLSEGEGVFCINLTIIQSVMWMWTFPEKLFKVFFLRRSYVLCLRRVVARTKVLTMVVIIIMAFFTYQRNLLLMTRCNQRQPILLIILSKSQGVTAFEPGFEFQFRESRPPSDFRCL